MSRWNPIYRIRTCFETAVRFVKKRRASSALPSARAVILVHQPELPLLDGRDSDEEILSESDEEVSFSPRCFAVCRCAGSGKDPVSAEQEAVQQLPEVQKTGPLTVRSISGKVVHSQDWAGDGMLVKDIVNSVCESTEWRADEVRLLAGANILDHNAIVGYSGCVAHPGPGQTFELSAAVVTGPPVTVESFSGRRIEVIDGVPEKGEECHFDREYVFTSLGDFADKKGMRFVMTSNDDRKTPSSKVMWQLDLREPAVVYINFRSENHIECGGALKWLKRDGWELKPDFKSTVSSGYPNGPYSGPVYAKSFHPENRKCLVNLMGSNYWEGTYFVFVHFENFESQD